ERDAARARYDHAVVAHLRRRERRIAVRGDDLALVYHRAGVSGVVEVVAAGQEVLVGDGQRGGEQPTDIDRRARCEQHAVRVGQEHLTVGGKTAEDFGRI